MKQLIYRSDPLLFDRATLGGILVRARQNNRRDNISGALICRHDLYLQLIEGPTEAIDALYSKIEGDSRHCDVRLLLTGKVDRRIFPEWTMLDDEFPSLAWSPEKVSDGALDEASDATLRKVFEGVAASARERGHPSN